MKLADIAKQLLNAESKALATRGKDGINVVPVSTIQIVDNKIWLVDYFFGKTRANLKTNPNEVSLVFWSGLSGFQIKAKSKYLTSGIDFDTAVAWIAELHPERVVYGLVELTPENIYDISIG